MGALRLAGPKEDPSLVGVRATAAKGAIMAIDEAKLAREAFADWRAEALEVLTTLFKAYPGVMRRGNMALLEPPDSPQYRKEQRDLLTALGEGAGGMLGTGMNDEEADAAFSAEIERRVAATSFQEVLKLLTAGHLPGAGTRRR
jgi:hypothetical protein